MKKKILLITDDIRAHSGVGTIGREIVFNTVKAYDWINIAGAIKHNEEGKKIDFSKQIQEKTGVQDASVTIYPTSGYGNPDIIRYMLINEKPDAIFLLTDPRYFDWLFAMESEIRKQIPIVYLNIWDDLPAPYYNAPFYESCDGLFAISKQTKFINKLVLEDKAKDKIIKYIPHGLNSDAFYPIKKENDKFKQFKQRFPNQDQMDFTLLFNSRNIGRKAVSDLLIAWKIFTDNLTTKEKARTRLILHTRAVEQHGTDLNVLLEYFFSKESTNIVITNNHDFSEEEMNMLYNLSDCVVLPSSNEGWGLSLTEAMLSGTPFIANVTGGMQDQMRFTDSNNKWYTPTKKVPSNHRGTYKTHGKWAFPIFPSNISLQGSIPTPYIFDDRCSFTDLAKTIRKVWKMDKKELIARGKAGRKWATSTEAGFTSKIMGERVIEGLEEVFTNWKPRPSYELVKDTDKLKPRLRHKLIY